MPLPLSALIALRRIALTLAATAVVLLLFAGCGKKGPPELTLEQVPDALQAAFASARQALRTNADGIGKLVLAKQFAAASLQLQAMSTNPNLSEEQRQVIAGATVAVNGKLQELAAELQHPAEAVPGELSATPPPPTQEAAEAAAVLDQYIRTK